MKYLISPPEKPRGWAIEPADLADQIEQRWPGTTVTTSTSPDDLHVLEWATTTPRGACQGALVRHGQALLLDGDVEACAEVALWFRGLVPPEIPLLFYDEDFNADVTVGLATTRDDIVRPFLAY